MNVTGIHSSGHAYFFSSQLTRETKKEDGKTEQASRFDTVSISGQEGASGLKSWQEEKNLEDPEKLWAEDNEEQSVASMSGENEKEEVSEQQGGKVAVNEGKRARQIAAAQSKDQLQQVLALLQEDMADCKAGLEKGWCDEAEVAKVEALIGQAKARMGQVSEKAEDPFGGLDAFDLASLM